MIHFVSVKFIFTLIQNNPAKKGSSNMQEKNNCVKSMTIPLEEQQNQTR